MSSTRFACWRNGNTLFPPVSSSVRSGLHYMSALLPAISQFFILKNYLFFHIILGFILISFPSRQFIQPPAFGLYLMLLVLSTIDMSPNSSGTTQTLISRQNDFLFTVILHCGHGSKPSDFTNKNQKQEWSRTTYSQNIGRRNVFPKGA